ncbi:ABC transporter substrate-binding protein [Roseiarcaceae bacterium H3SJ34-1]|uniref:ABC transporter substrate-binding protein n=1 Tax=Terripilifer ovatus TaxID=3032367 RepID=UPI003AB95093|nr:ABC transporter substrate-binding protein [Roseiarcaceae bacterium H3SJ34-1]
MSMRSALRALALGFALVPAASATQAADKVTIGVVGSSSDVVFYMAQNLGYFKAQNIEPDFSEFDSAARMIAPLGSGALDVGAGAVGAGLYNAVQRGINIKIVGDKAHCEPGQSYVALLVRKALVESGKFKGLGDLKGRKIALAGAGTGDSSTLNDALRKGGASGFADADVVYMGFSQQALAFQNGAIDASLTAEPSVALIVATGSAVRYAGVDAISPRQQTAVLLYGGDFATTRPDVATRFMKAYILAIRDYNAALSNGRLVGAKGNAVIKLMQEHMPVKDPAILRAMVPHAVDRDAALNVAGLEKDHRFFVTAGLASQNVPVANIIDDSFRTRALKEIDK